jgi:parvulin-like peptidyl-prolyl isomerase
LGLKGTTLKEWKGRLEEKLLAEKMVRSALQYPGEISEKEALQYYEAHRSSFRLDLKVRARQIVVADGEEAIQILKRLKKGEKFEKLAQEKSLGPEKVKGGDLGAFGPGEKPEEFDRVFAMEVGTLSEVIKSPYGYHIFKLEEKVEAREIAFEEAKTGILQELRKKNEEEEYQRWLKDLRKKAKVIVNKKWVQS